VPKPEEWLEAKAVHAHVSTDRVIKTAKVKKTLKELGYGLEDRHLLERLQSVPTSQINKGRVYFKTIIFETNSALFFAFSFFISRPR
jgi:hypothetical protein